MRINKLGLFAVLTTGIFTLSSCEELKEAANVDVDTSFSDTFTFAATVPTDTATGAASFSESGSLDLSETEAADYVDKIQDIEIKTVTMTVLSYTGEADATFSGEIDLGEGFNLPINSVQLQPLFDSGEALDVSDNAGAFNYLKDQLKNQKQLTYTVNASINKVPASTSIRLDYELVVTANPLD